MIRKLEELFTAVRPAYSLGLAVYDRHNDFHTPSKLSQEIFDLVSNSDGPHELLSHTGCLIWLQQNVHLVDDVSDFVQTPVLEFLFEAGGRWAAILQELCKALSSLLGWITAIEYPLQWTHAHLNLRSPIGCLTVEGFDLLWRKIHSSEDVKAEVYCVSKCLRNREGGCGISHGCCWCGDGE